MFAEPLKFGNDYVYIGIGQYITAFLIGFPSSFIVSYVIYRYLTTTGTFKEVKIINFDKILH
jgi:hypothetical protein